MPRSAPRVKVDGVREYGAEVVLCEPTLADRHAAAEATAMRVGGLLIHAGADRHVFAGQGTTALEILDQVPLLDAILVPVGGGGLISGVAIAAKTLNPSICIIGAEPKAADDAARSLRAGRHIQGPDSPETAADGLRTSLTPLAWQMVAALVETVITASECEIELARNLIEAHLCVRVEPSAAVTVAVAMSTEFRAFRLQRVGVILTGGTV
jgi:threonine dehydratase